MIFFYLGLSFCLLIFKYFVSVTGVVGRAELLSSVFVLLTILLYQRSVQTSSYVALILAMLSVSCAMLCKEQGITVLAILVIYEVFLVQKMMSSPSLLQFWRKKISWAFSLRLLTVICTGALLLSLRFLIMGHTLPVFTNFDNPASYAQAPAKQLTYAYLLAVNAWLLLAPAQLLCDWTMGTVPLVLTLADPRNLATLVLIVILGNLAFNSLFAKGQQRRLQKGLILALALLAFPFVPASNLFFPVGFVVAERVLYIPSMGFCLLVAMGCDNLLKRGAISTGQFWPLFSLFLAIQGLKCFVRNQDWQTEESIFLSGLKVSSANAKLWNNVGHALESKKDYVKALEFFIQATNAQPDDVGAHINVGRTLNHLQRFADAEQAYLKAKSLLPQPKIGQRYVTRIAPQHLSVFLNLGNLMAKDPGRLEEADQLYRQAIAMRQDYVQAYINRVIYLMYLRMIWMVTFFKENLNFMKLEF